MIDIVRAIRDPRLIGDAELSDAQEIILRAINGLPLPNREIETRFFEDGAFVRRLDSPLDMFRRCTGRQTYERREYSMAAIIAGRRSGKTEKILANQLIYEANFRERPDRPGDEPEAMIVSRTVRQAHKAYRYCTAKQKRSATLQARMVGDFRKDDYDLADGSVVSVWPCSSENTRSAGAFFIGCDEISFWKNRESNSNPANEVLRALRPSLAMYEPHGKLILISTPFAKTDGDPMWDAMKSRDEHPEVLVWQQPSWELNPNISDAFLLAEFARDSESFFREWGARFWESAANFLGSDQVESCVARGVSEVAPEPGGHYTAALDAAFRGPDSFAFTICRNLGGRVQQCLLRVWKGTRLHPVDMAAVLGEICDLLARFGIHECHGDNFCSAPLQQILKSKGVTFIVSHTLGQTALPMWMSLRSLVSSRSIELLDDPASLAELKSLQLVATGSGNSRVEAAGSQHDDRAVCVALGAHFSILATNINVPFAEVIRIPAPASPLGIGSVEVDRHGITWHRL